MKKINFYLLGACIIFLILFIFIYSQKGLLTPCGDGVCGPGENCNNCLEDCGCKPNEYCIPIGVCREHVCGDEICSEEEYKIQICCEDCGCPDNKVCNEYTRTCQERAKISEEAVRRITNTYMEEEQIEGNILNIEDTYYKDKIVKEVTIDCRGKESSFPCMIIIYINSEGQIVDELWSA